MSEAPAIAIVTLGCPKNEVDSDRMAAAVSASAYRLIEDPEDADVVILNTCAFIRPAVEEAIDTAFELTARWRPARHGRRVVVAGCLPSRYGAELEMSFPEPDAFVPVAEEGAILATIERLTGVPSRASGGRTRTVPGHTAYLKVSEGCGRRCAYCTIPAIRGPFVSANPVSLLEEARFLVDHGARELVLVGQDIAAYGRDRSGSGGLPELVKALDRIEGDFRIRLMYVQPDGVTGRLLETMASADKVCAYLDIPLQHAAEPVLHAMGRTGSAEAHLRLLERVRAALPGVTLRTTMMAGFPGETAADARTAQAFIAEAGFDYVGVFAYSPEEGTPAASFDGQVSLRTRRARAQRLRDVADRVGFDRAAAQTGSVVRVLSEGPDEHAEHTGRTCGQAPDVDGVTFLDRPVPAGEWAAVTIVGSVGYDLVGEVR